MTFGVMVPRSPLRESVRGAGAPGGGAVVCWSGLLSERLNRWLKAKGVPSDTSSAICHMWVMIASSLSSLSEGLGIKSIVFVPSETFIKNDQEKES